MNTTQYIWQDGKMVPWNEAQIHVLTHSLHYGSAVFEGIRAYETASGPAIFKLNEHMERLYYSADKMGMTIPFSQKIMTEAAVEIIRVNHLSEAYIRPLVFYGYGNIKVMPSSKLPIQTVIACWPWGDYLPVKAVDVTVSEYIRIHPKSTIANAKISGHYVNSILAGLSIKGTHYHEALLLDAEGYVAEGSAENVFIVKNGKIITPPKGTILEGITRETIFEIAQDLGIPIEEQYFTPDAVINADEAFFSGTAVEVTAIRSLDDRLISDGKIGPITEKIQTYYQQMVHGELEQYHDALTWVELKANLQSCP